MKKRFLPFSLLLVIMILGQSVMADQGGHYVPRTQATMNAESFMGSLRVNQNTGLIDPADMFKAMQTPATKNGADEPLYWISMGPDNMGGQTNAIVYDNTKNAHGNPNGVVYIGSKGGGVYKTYNYGITWHQVGDLDLMVSTMVQDKDGVIYVGTGDGGDNINQNGLTQLGYTNSFVGTGIWAIDARNNDATEQIVAPTAEEWLFVNELAIADGKLIAATSDGLKYSTDKGATWAFAKVLNDDGEPEDITDEAVEVKVGVDNLIVASVAGLVYIGFDIEALVCHSGTSNALQGDTLLPKAGSLYDIAVSPVNSGVIYAASIDGGVHKGVFRSDNNGENWITVLPAIGSTMGNSHSIYEGYGLYNHGLVVDPTNDGVVYVLGYNLWRLQRTASGVGNYLCEALTSNSTIDDPSYIHVGLHAMTFNPNNSNEYYIGTNGGIFKGTRNFTFANCNRNYVTSRMFNVACGGKDTRILAAGLDHGTVLIEGDDNTNTMGSGLWINPTGDNQGAFSDDSHAGACAMSSINPNTFIVTYSGGGLKRTETAGGDWVSTNFTEYLANSFALEDEFYTPILLQENYNDPTSKDSVWFKNDTVSNLPSGETVTCMSKNNYPFEYTLNHALMAGDSIEVPDPVTARMIVATKNAVYLTFMPLRFSEATIWYKLFTKQVGFSGIPLCVAMTPDGDDLFVGTKAGRLYHWAGLNSAVDTVWTTGSSSSLKIYHGKLVAPTYENFGHCVTSIAIDQHDYNKVIVTLGNYGNEDYVLYSTNALSETPEYVSVQGNLPKMPVYSSLIEMETGDVIIGTERGIYRCKDIANAEWVSDSKIMGEVPVMELKQQTLFQEDKQVVKVTEDGVFVTNYPGVHNTGVIYAATYGRGAFRCENYKRDFTSVPETPAVVENVTVSMYPNPVQSQATVSFDVKDNASVNYQVFDLTGRMVMNQNLGRFTEGSHQFQINAENLSTGSYILRLNRNGNSTCVKFLVY